MHGRKRWIVLFAVMSAMVSSGYAHYKNRSSCSYEDNPLYVKHFSALKLIPPEHVTCDVNHNDNLKEKLILVGECNPRARNAKQYIIPDNICSPRNCSTSFSKWFDSIKSSVMDNLEITMKVKLLNLFNNGNYNGFKRAILRGHLITDLEDENVFMLILIGEEVLKNYILQDADEKPDYEFYQEEFGEMTRLYGKLQYLSEYPDRIPKQCNIGCYVSNNSYGVTIQECVKKITDGLLHWETCDKYNFKEYLEAAIRLVREYFGNDEPFELNVPMLPECFKKQYY